VITESRDPRRRGDLPPTTHQLGTFAEQLWALRLVSRRGWWSVNTAHVLGAGCSWRPRAGLIAPVRPTDAPTRWPRAACAGRRRHGNDSAFASLRGHRRAQAQPSDLHILWLSQSRRGHVDDRHLLKRLRVTVVWRHERFSGVATRCAAFAYARSCSALWTLLWFVARRALVRARDEARSDCRLSPGLGHRHPA